ncbi:MAG: type I secretion system permease/ATPase [Rhizobiales bacterium PAR1]|nr:MAG: type I secretion system permease/ATPase [Rhizobiales bacterium PAR1]
MSFLENARNSHLLNEARAFFPAQMTLLATSAVIALVSLTPTVFMMQIYERVVQSRNVFTLLALVVISFFLVGLWTVLEDLRIQLARRVAFALDEKISPRVLDTLNRYPDTLPPNQAPLVYQDLANLREFLASPLMMNLLDVIFVPIIILAAVLMNIWLGVALFLLTALSAMLTLMSQNATKEDTARTVMAANRAHEFGRTVQSNAEPARVLGMLSRLVARWRSLTVDSVGWSHLAADRARRVTFPLRYLRHSLPMILQVVAVSLFLNELAGPGLLVAVGILSARVIGPVDAVANGWRMIWNLTLSVDRINAVLIREAKKVSHVSLPRPEGPLIVNRISVIPRGRDAATLQDVSFVAAPGTVVGVVGPSGAGKSTLARALTGAWPLARGSIVLDGHDISHWDQEELGRYIGYVPQDIDLLPGTLAENIARFEPVTGENSPQLIAAVKSASILDIVSRLPEGLSTRMGADGRVLSGGQRQRVALARALYGDPRLVVLDEPNSNIDAAGEQQLGSAIDSLRAAGAIVILITHRMNMLSYCDQVLVLNGGAVHAFGGRDFVLDRIGSSAPKQLTDERGRTSSAQG